MTNNNDIPGEIFYYLPALPKNVTINKDFRGDGIFPTIGKRIITLCPEHGWIESDKIYCSKQELIEAFTKYVMEELE